MLLQSDLNVYVRPMWLTSVQVLHDEREDIAVESILFMPQVIKKRFQ